ncbi:MAG: transglycosylase SLT domain-containing protein, partial [Desulfatiglandales bacterium]|nr:transglycosylase SLT domain-containing protein [Desulfatiglandales bacterium]
MRSLLFFSRLTSLLLALNVLAMAIPSLTFSEEKATSPVFHDFAIPESLSLCGEAMPLENRRVREMLDREFTISVWDRAQVFLWLKRAGRYFPYIEEKLAEAGMPDDLKYLAVAESALILNARSNQGAVGPWQFMAHTGRHIGLRLNRMLDERQNFERSTEAALKYLKLLKKIFGTWTLAIAAYNSGDARLKKRMRKQKESKADDYYSLDLPAETERYIFRIAATKIIMENPQRYGYSLKPESVYRPLEGDMVPIKIRVQLHLTDMAQALGTDFKGLQELNPQIIGYYLPPGSYKIKVPSGLGSRLAGLLKQLTPPLRRKQATDGHYLVQPGDTLSHIAQITSVPVST